MVMASHCVGFTLPGMMDEPGSFSGMWSSPKPQRGPDAVAPLQQWAAQLALLRPGHLVLGKEGGLEAGVPVWQPLRLDHVHPRCLHLFRHVGSGPVHPAPGCRRFRYECPALGKDKTDDALVTLLLAQWDRSLGFLFVAWLFNYIPFFLMGRMLFLHHYLPAYILTVILTTTLFDFLGRQPADPAMRPNVPMSRWQTGQGGLVFHGVVLGLMALSICCFVYFMPLSCKRFGTQLT